MIDRSRFVIGIAAGALGLFLLTTDLGSDRSSSQVSPTVFGASDGGHTDRLLVTVDPDFVGRILERASHQTRPQVEEDIRALRGLLESESTRELQNLHAKGDSRVLARSRPGVGSLQIEVEPIQAIPAIGELTMAQVAENPEGDAEFRLAYLDRDRYPDLWAIALEIRILESVADNAPN